MVAPNNMNKAQYRAWSRPLMKYLEGTSSGKQGHTYTVAEDSEPSGGPATDVILTSEGGVKWHLTVTDEGALDLVEVTE